MDRADATALVARELNSSCRCLSVEVPALRREVERRLREAGVPVDLAATHPHLFSSAPVFVSEADATRMAAVVRAIDAAVALPGIREAAIALAPQVARRDDGTRGAFLGFDFHLSPDGPKLIEINTNAGGGFLASLLGEAAVACCGRTVAQGSEGGYAKAAVAMLVEEWRAGGRDGRPRTVAIVDATPSSQYLHPEFLLAQAALRAEGIEAIVAAPEDLSFDGAVLRAGDVVVDLVYNRLTDFALAGDALAPLREAFLAGSAVVTPNPRAHALFADKRMLAVLGDEARLRDAGLPAADAALLAAAIPATRMVDASDAEALWAGRKTLFFKPFAGFGSRGAYRGDKLTRRVFDEILAGGYVAQALVPPAERCLADEAAPPLKYDVRNYAYAGEVQLLAARLWRGQTTNFRTEGGGFAPVFVLPTPLARPS